ncbi:MAG TPA: DNA-directed DNA polymerase II small subunit [Methanocellales archaeon]|nr:DNA-directed DNA polymerase II small subunit [Methanocellales archaeon]
MGEDTIQRFAEAGHQIHPDAVAMIQKHEGSIEALMQDILTSLDDSVLVVTPEHVRNALSRPSAEVRVLSDITSESTCFGGYDEFVLYFRDRYAKLSDMIRGRVNARPIESLNKVRGETAIIGMVSDIRNTSNGHKLIELEDPTGMFPVLLQKNKGLLEVSDHIILDEVIGVTGNLTKDGKLLIASNVLWPDIPVKNQSRRAFEQVFAVLTSDIHVGSKTFLEGAWFKFIKWLNGDLGDDDQRTLAEKVKYIVIAGDLVDGIGVYPDQEKDLLIPDIYEQYQKAAEYLREVPTYIKIIISPGNHDAVRQAEPQPALPKKITDMFCDLNVMFLGNPSLVELDGIKALIYHGRSLDDFVAALPGLSYKEPDRIMVEMLRRRHLFPIYGERVSIAPEKKDHFVIDSIPDILHCGHVHTIGLSKYRGVTLVNSGTWQSQTDFQKRVNLEPVPAHVPIIDLSTMESSILKFA